jgi:flavin reductase (DIM6/NTAB) family NADH-FMN oxidoreductase RutF
MDAETFRDAMRAWATGVAVISTHTGQARHGMTVNSFTSVSLDPPLVSVCIQNDLRILPMIRDSGTFAISVLGAGQEDISNQFAGRSTEDVDRFEGVPTRTAVSGAPILAEALAYFDCRVEASYPGGTHTIVVGAVLDAKRVEGEPLVYWNRGYRRLADPAFDKRALMDAFERWRHDGLHQLGLIQSWAQLTLQDNSTALPETVQAAFDSIVSACHNAVALWNNITANLQLRAETGPVARKAIRIDEAIAEAVQYLKVSAGIENVSVTLPDGLPAVGSTDYLSIAIETLLTLQAGQPKTALRLIEVSPPGDGRIKVRCAIAASLPELTRQRLFQPGSEFDTVRLFIRRHGGELPVTHLEHGTQFEFTLPVWQDPGAA